jgi:hypothetical protein
MALNNSFIIFVGAVHVDELEFVWRGDAVATRSCTRDDVRCLIIGSFQPCLGQVFLTLLLGMLDFCVAFGFESVHHQC